jgi:hypothetical protein
VARARALELHGHISFGLALAVGLPYPAVTPRLKA